MMGRRIWGCVRGARVLTAPVTMSTFLWQHALSVRCKGLDAAEEDRTCRIEKSDRIVGTWAAPARIGRTEGPEGHRV